MTPARLVPAAPRLWMDYETFSGIDLTKSNVYRYVEDPLFEALMCGWSRDGINFHVAEGEAEIRRIPGLADPAVLHIAHNAGFERVVTSAVLGMPVGSYLSPEMFEDTQARAAEHGYPQSLEALARRLRCAPKDSAGKALIRRFSMLDSKGRRYDKTTHPEEWARFLLYCKQDVETLVEVDDRLPGWPTQAERDTWDVDQRINDRGIKVDLPMARLAVAADQLNAAAAKIRIRDIAGIQNPNSVPQMKAWLNDCALGLPNLKAETIEAALSSGTLNEVETEVLTLRGDLALASSAKYGAVLLGTNDDGRLRGQLKFGGAHTMRWAGKGVQVHNLPRKGFKDRVEGADDLTDDELEWRAQILTDAAIADLMLGFGADPVTLKMLVRPTIVGPVTVLDYNAIEARVLAWWCGEEWVLQAFREGRDIYVETANRMSTGSKRYTRSHGKVAVLALGFNGAVNSLRNMGATGDDEELLNIVTQWRRSNRRIVAAWEKLGEAIASGGRIGPHVRVERRGSKMLIHLPSGRAITYHGVRWERYTIEDALTGRRIKKQGWRYDSPRGAGRIGTYGGKLAENITQAIARDILAHGLVKLDAAGYPVVLHVHDEAGIDGVYPVKDIEAVMCDLPSWADGLPIAAKGNVKARYSK